MIEKQGRVDLPILPSWILIPFILAVLTLTFDQYEDLAGPSSGYESDGFLTDMF